MDIGEDRIVLNTRSGIYFLDIFLPFNLNQDECGAQFDKKTQVLTITMPVVKIIKDWELICYLKRCQILSQYFYLIFVKILIKSF